MNKAELAERAAAPAAAALATFLALWLLAGWLGRGPGRVAPRTAVPENRGGAGPAPPSDLRGSFLAFAPPSPGPASSPPESGSWPRFRGASFDNQSRDPVPLAPAWPAGGPPVLWSLDLGEGHGGAAVCDGRVYLLDFMEGEESDAVRCFSLQDGRELWRRWYRTGAKRNHGVSRTVPSVSGRYVVTLGPRCHAVCLDARTGDFLWGVDLVVRFGATEPLWYAAQCPLIEGDRVVIAPGGSALMAAFDAGTGRVLWETPNPRGWRMSHSTVTPMTLGGRRTYVYCALGGVAGVAADGPDAGTLLWETSEWAPTVNAPSPVELGGGRIAVTAGYGAGGAVIEVAQAGGRFAARVTRRFPPSVFACEQQTPVFRDGLLFTVLPPDGDALHGQFACLDPSGPPDPGGRGPLLWASGRDRRYGLGPYLAAPGRFFLLADDGVLTMARADRSGFSEMGRARVLPGSDAWAPMALAGGRLLLRDSRKMVCLDLREPLAAPAPAKGPS